MAGSVWSVSEGGSSEGLTDSELLSRLLDSRRAEFAYATVGQPTPDTLPFTFQGGDYGQQGNIYIDASTDGSKAESTFTVSNYLYAPDNPRGGMPGLQILFAQGTVTKVGDAVTLSAPSYNGYFGHYTATVTGFANSSVLELLVPGKGAVVFSVYGLNSGSTLTFSDNSLDTFSAAMCFAAGTLIRTPRGEAPIERLAVGDLVVTVSGEARPITWIGSRTMRCEEAPDPATCRPVRVRAGAIAPGLPARDLMLSPLHSLYFDDVLIPVGRLINGTTIVQEPCAQVAYWHLALETHDAVLAEGLPAETYLDPGDNAFFADGKDEEPPRAEGKYFAPHALRGPRLHAVKAWLIARAKHLGARWLEDPGLQVLANGSALTPVSVSGRRFRFDVPEGTTALRLRSRISVPAHWIADNEDGRTLGVRVDALWLDGQAVALDRDLTAGWHAGLDGGGRWTDGDATLPLAGTVELQADWFLGYPQPLPTPLAVERARCEPLLRLVAQG